MDAKQKIDPRTVFMVCGSDEVAKDVGDCLKRVSSTMSAFDAFTDALEGVDEDGPDFMEQLGPVLHRFMLTVTSVYPDARQMQADITSIGDFTVRTI